MNNKIHYLLGGMILLVSTLVTGNEYIPPPTGPYQSTVVINTVDKNSAEKKQVYKFPQADLIQPRSVEPILPSSSNPGLSAEPLKSDSGSYSLPASPGIQGQPGSGNQGVQPYYDPSLYNNPWAENSTPQQQGYQQPGYQGQWTNPGGAYGYYQYPDSGYSNQYNTMVPPYSRMPTPWSMMPTKPGR